MSDENDRAGGLLLRESGLRRTPVRIAVLSALAQDGQPMGVQQVLQHLPAGTDAVTVYRTLNTFTRKKLVHRVHGEDRSWRYALSKPLAHHAPRHEHPHFVCDTCGSVECLEKAKIPTDLVAHAACGSAIRRAISGSGAAWALPAVSLKPGRLVGVCASDAH